jgi:hypothetical protein
LILHSLLKVWLNIVIVKFDFHRVTNVIPIHIFGSNFFGVPNEPHYYYDWKKGSLKRKFEFSSGSPKFDFELTSDSIYFKLNLKLNSNEGGFTFLADGKSGKVSADAATVKATYVKGSALEVTFKHGGREAKMTCTLSRNEEKAGTLKVDFKNNFLTKFKVVQFEGTAQYTTAKKSAALVIIGIFF